MKRQKRKNMARRNNAIRGTQLMKETDVHAGKINSTTMLRLCNMMIIPKASNGLRLVRSLIHPKEGKEIPKKELFKIALGVFAKSKIEGL